MDKKESLLQQKAKAEKEARQYENQIKILLKKQRDAERTVRNERLEMWAQYEKYKPIRQKLDKLKPGKREKYQQEHSAELASFSSAATFLKSLKESGEAITPKAWKAEAVKLTAQKDMDYTKMRAMRDEIKAVVNLRKAADRLAHEGQHQQKGQDR